MGQIRRSNFVKFDVEFELILELTMLVEFQIFSIAKFVRAYLT